MATKKQSSSSVTRIKATSSKSAPKTKAVADKKPTTSTKQSTSARSARPIKGILGTLLRPFVLLGGYFKGAWVELRQVHWPNRQATWSLTLAVLLFTAFFATLILLLDAGFKYLFELLLT